MFAAMRRGSSLLSNLAAERRPGFAFIIDVGKLLPVVIADHKEGVQFLDSPRRREAAGRAWTPNRKLRETCTHAELNGDWGLGDEGSRRQDNNTGECVIFP
jgi:hypothetical protein